MTVSTREMPFPLTAEEVARFMTRVGRGDSDACWPWTGSRPGKLGCFHLRGKGYKAPRIALMLHRGKPIENCLVVRQTCSDPNCVNPAHLYAWTKETIMECRFWSKVDKTEGNGHWGDCWMWRGPFRKKYGVLGVRGKSIPAHRLSLIIESGEPEDSEALCLHSCDITGCVNPKHLRWGTQAENMQDMLSRGRGRWQ